MDANYYEMLARSERRFAAERKQTVESARVHIKNAETYERIAADLRKNAQHS
mgnify:CR=1 FL=1